jgi:hypothetical protein
MNPGVALRVKSFHTMLDGLDPVSSPVYEVESVDVANREIKFIAQTEAVDCERQVVVASGAETSYFFKNRRIFIDHEYDVRSHIGTLRAAIPWNGSRPTKMGAQDHNSWWVKLYILPLTRNPIGDDILTMAKHGGVGTSIGYDKSRSKVRKATPTDVARWGKGGTPPQSIMYEWAWIEQTITAMPCNGECQSIDGGKAAIIENQLGKGMIQRESAKAMGFPVREKRRIVFSRAPC